MSASNSTPFSSPSSTTTEPSDTMQFFMLLGQAKRTKRKGWVLRGVRDAESIADHMYRMSMMAFLAPEPLDRLKCVQMCLVHDLTESIVGDITPVDDVSGEQKQLMENVAMNTLTKLIDGDQVAETNQEASVEPKRGSQIMRDLYEEYSAHMSREAKYVKSLDLLDMYLQAYEYELLQNCQLEEFFGKVPRYLADDSPFEPQVKRWLSELMRLRETRVNVLAADSNCLEDVLDKWNKTWKN